LIAATSALFDSSAEEDPLSKMEQPALYASAAQSTVTLGRDS